MGGCVVGGSGPIDWTTIYKGEKGEEMNRRDREIARMPWVIDYTRNPYSIQKDDNQNMVKKTSCYLQHKEDTGTFGHMIPHSIVDYKDGIPSVVRVYDIEENHKLFQEKAMSVSGFYTEEDEEHKNFMSFHETYSAYQPIVTYYLPNQLAWAWLKNEEDAGVIVKGIESVAETSSMIDIVKFTDPFEEKGFWDNLKDALSSKKDKPATPNIIMRVSNNPSALEYR